jgi:putative ABC transport system permease protein
VRRAVQRRDASLPVFDVKTLATQVRETHYADRLITMLSIAFGSLATLLAAVGLYGVMAFAVAQRRSWEYEWRSGHSSCRCCEWS